MKAVFITILTIVAHRLEAQELVQLTHHPAEDRATRVVS
jgi:hypothetical protein